MKYYIIYITSAIILIIIWGSSLTLSNKSENIVVAEQVVSDTIQLERGYHVLDEIDYTIIPPKCLKNDTLTPQPVPVEENEHVNISTEKRDYWTFVGKSNEIITLFIGLVNLYFIGNHVRSRKRKNVRFVDDLI